MVHPEPWIDIEGLADPLHRIPLEPDVNASPIANRLAETNHDPLEALVLDTLADATSPVVDRMLAELSAGEG